MALLVRVLRSLLLVSAASLRADVQFAFQLAIVGGMLISFVNVVRFFVRVSSTATAAVKRQAETLLLLRLRVAVRAIGLTMLYNVNQLGYDAATGLRDTTKRTMPYSYGVNSVASASLSGC